MKFAPNLSDEDRTTMQKLDIKKAYVWLSTWFGSGFMRPAPGTWGTLAAMPFGILLLIYTNPFIILVAVITITLIGVWAARCFENATGIHDSKMIVIDEVAGMWLTLLPLSIFLSHEHPYYAALICLAFALFRLFDITKPWPACYFDKHIHNSIGVMGDDIIAGIYAAAALTGVIYYAGFS